MEAGDLIRFSKDHWTQGGLDYTAEWIGVVVEKRAGTLDPDPKMTPAEQRFHRGWDTIRIMWGVPAGEKIVMEYSEQWWNTLGYSPFEVMNESG